MKYAWEIIECRLKRRFRFFDPSKIAPYNSSAPESRVKGGGEDERGFGDCVWITPGDATVSSGNLINSDISVIGKYSSSVPLLSRRALLFVPTYVATRKFVLAIHARGKREREGASSFTVTVSARSLVIRSTNK